MSFSDRPLRRAGSHARGLISYMACSFAHFGVGTAPNAKSSNTVTLSALVHRPTAPAPLMRLSCTSIYVLPLSDTLIDAPAKSTRSVCHMFLATGASTYLIVLRRPLAV